jgi:hypothetical protein
LLVATFANLVQQIVQFVLQICVFSVTNLTFCSMETVFYVNQYPNFNIKMKAVTKFVVTDLKYMLNAMMATQLMVMAALRIVGLNKASPVRKILKLTAQISAIIGVLFLGLMYIEIYWKTKSKSCLVLR